MSRASTKRVRREAPVATAAELAQAVQALSGISESLVASYARLAEHAQHVEDDLVVANQSLAGKVAELDALSAHLEAILHALPLGIVVRDAHGRIVRANRAACRMLETSERALCELGTHPWLAGARADGQSREIFDRDGRLHVVAERSSPITDRSGASGASVETLDDRTELVELAERVHKLDKLAALGSMAAGIAHEIRNPMNAMLGFAELIKRELPQHSRAHRYAARIADGVTEVDAIIANMLSFSDPQRLRLETCDAAEVVAQALQLVARTLPMDTGVDTDGASGAPVTWRLTENVASTRFVADQVKVRHALRNLVANAVQAQPGGGAVHVALVASESDLAFHVTDEGPGIPAEVRGRLGEPFFTTRADGTGLGLSLVHTIADLHGGRFDICPHPRTCPHGGGRGAHVAFHIPQQPTEKPR
jgi:two-component system, sensor histidine kinase FlrB